MQDARIYTRPEEPVPVYVSGFAPQAAELAGRVGDGYRLAMPDADLVRAFRAAGGGHKPVQAGMKVNWDADRDVAAEVAHRPVGHLRAAVKAPRRHAAKRLRRRPTAAGIAWRGRRDHRVQARPDRHAAKVEAYADAGVDEAYVQQIGPDMAVFFAAWEKDVLPRFHT